MQPAGSVPHKGSENPIPLPAAAASQPDLEPIAIAARDALSDHEDDWGMIYGSQRPLPESSNAALKNVHPSKSIALPVVEISKKAAPRPFKEPWVNRFIESIGKVVTTSMELVNEKEKIPEALIKFGIGKVERVPKEGGEEEVRVGGEAKQLPAMARKGASLFFELGLGVNDKFDRFIANYNPDFTISSRSHQDFNEALNWMLLDEYSPPEGQIAKIFEELKNLEMPPSLAIYREPISHWLLAERETKCLHASIDFAGYKETEAKECLRLIVRHLLEKKVEQLATRFANLFDEQLPGTIHAHLCNELAIPIVRIELEKVGEIIRHMKWGKLVDECVAKFRDFAKATNISLEARNERLKKLNSQSEDAVHLADGTMQSAYVGNPKDSTAHPITQKVENERRLNHNFAAARDSEEQAFFREKVNLALEMFLPTDADSIQFWKDQISLPKPFEELLDQAKSLAEQIVDPRVMAIFNAAPGWLRDNVEGLIVDRVKKFAVNMALDVIVTKLDRFTDPDKLDEMLHQKILPGLMPVLLQQIMGQEIKQLIVLSDKTTLQERTTLAKLLCTHKAKINDYAQVKQLYESNKNEASLRMLEQTQQELDNAAQPLRDCIRSFWNKQKLALELQPDQLEKAISLTIDDLEKRVSNKANSPESILADLSESYKPKATLSNRFKHIMRRAMRDVPAKKRRDLYEGNGKVVEDIQKFLRERVKKKLSKEDLALIKDGDIDSESQVFLNSLIEKIRNRQLSQNDFTVNDIDDFFTQYFAEMDAAKQSLKTYISLIEEVLKMTTFGGAIKTLVPLFVKSKMKAATQDLRASPEMVFNILSSALPEALDKETLDDLIYTPSSAPKEPLRQSLRELKAQGDAAGVANHELTKQRVGLQKQMIGVATLAERFIRLNIEWASDHDPDAKVRMALNFATKGIIYNCIGKPTELAENILKIYKSLLGNQFRLKDVVYKVVDTAFKAIYNEWKYQEETRQRVIALSRPVPASAPAAIGLKK
jgi:hypothetical protein